MTVDDLQVLIRDKASFRRALRKADTNREDAFKNDVVALLNGQFRQGRAPYIHQVTLPDGSQIRMKFVDTVKKIFNSKNVEQVGKESYLSYLEVTVAPAGSKAYFFTCDVKQVVWGMAKSKATAEHEQNLTDLKITADEVGIDLTPKDAWFRVYSENY